MKIAHLTSGHSPNDTRVFLKECRSLAAAGHDVSLVFPGSAKQSNIDNVKLVGTGINPKSRWDRILNTPKQVFKTGLSLNADVYHFHDPALIPYGRKLKALGKIVIYDAHEDVPRQTLSKDYLFGPARPLLARWLEAYENKAAREFDLVIAATPTIAKRFADIGARSEVVANYPLKSEFPVAAAEVTRDKKTACYVGVMTKIRGFCEMVNAMTHLNGAKLVLAGPRPGHDLVSSVAKCEGWKKAETLGELDRQGIQNLLSRATVGLVVLHPIPNYLDAFPIKMFEYMAAGLPVIASNFPLWKKIVEDNGCGICVNPNDSKAIAQAIQFIFDNPEKAKEMGQRGREAVQSSLNWEQEEKKLLKAYEPFRKH